MTRPLLIRFAGLVLAAMAAAGFFSVAAAQTAESVEEASAAPAADDLPPKAPVAQPTTTTTVAPTTTTTTVAPTTTTTAPPVTAPPVTSPPTTAAAPPPPPPAPVAVTVPAPTHVPAPVQAPSMNACESELMRLTNEARQANGVAALVADGAIAHIPKAWANQMLSIGNLAHNPGYAGAVFAARPESNSVAENVGRSTGSVHGVFDSFMQSSSHRAAILSHGFTHAAAGCSTDALGQHWVAVNFWG